MISTAAAEVVDSDDPGANTAGANAVRQLSVGVPVDLEAADWPI
jgi:hypothetical protein